MSRLARNIYKRNDGRYEGRYIKGYDADGKAKYGSVFARTYADVKTKLDNVKSPAIQSIEGAPRTLKETLAGYMFSVKSKLKPSTYAVYQRYIENHIVPYFGNARCETLSQAMFQGFADKLLENGLSVVTVQSVFSFLKSSAKPALAKDALSVSLPKPPKHEVEFFSVNEQKRLESAAKASGVINFLSVILCLYTGIRIGEVSGLQWEDIDFERKAMSIRRTLQRIHCINGERRTRIAVLTPKSPSSMRTIPLPNFLIDVLREYKTKAESAFVLSQDGQPVEPRNIQYRFKKLLKTADVKQVNFHATRHTFSVRALENGFDVKSLSEILGHASATITLNKYAHALEEHKRNRMNALEALYH